MDLRDAFLRHVRERNLLPSGSRVLVALSGGADSTALALLVHECRDDLDLADLRCAHLDHGLRPTSAAEAEKVRVWVDSRLGAEAIVERREVRAAAGESPEEAARRVRYGFLTDVARQLNASHVLTGHHADDQAETVLQRILRGTGATGLLGIMQQRPLFGLTDDVLPFHGSVSLVRPLLPFRAAELRMYLQAQDASWIEDPTNRDGNERARLRHLALPVLAECTGRDPVPLLARLSQNLELYPGSSASEISASFIISEEDKILVFHAFTLLPHSVKATALRDRVPALRDGAPLTRAETERLIASLAGDDAGEVSGIALVRRPKSTHLVPRRAPGESPAPVPMTGPGEVRLWDERTLRIGVEDAGNSPFLERLSCSDGTMELADADRIASALTVRTRRPGDRIHALGAPGPSRLGHVLQRRGVPAADRDLLPLLCDDEGIVWACGVALADRVRVTPETARIAVLEIQEHDVNESGVSAGP